MPALDVVVKRALRDASLDGSMQDTEAAARALVASTIEGALVRAGVPRGSFEVETRYTSITGDLEWSTKPALPELQRLAKLLALPRDQRAARRRAP